MVVKKERDEICLYQLTAAGVILMITGVLIILTRRIMAKQYVMIYYDFLEIIEPLSNAERGRLLTAILQYGKNGVAKELSGNERFVFPVIKAQIERDNKAYEEKCRISAINGKLGGRPRKEPAGLSKNHEVLGESRKSQEDDEEKEDDKNKNKDETASFRFAPECDAEVPPLPQNSEEAVTSLLLSDKTEYEITKSHINEWALLYPAVDIVQQLRNMKGWILANPAKAKSRQGILRFINGWLVREQNKLPETEDKMMIKPKRKNRFNNFESHNRDWDEIEKLELERLQRHFQDKLLKGVNDNA